MLVQIVYSRYQDKIAKKNIKIFCYPKKIVSFCVETVVDVLRAGQKTTDFSWMPPAIAWMFESPSAAPDVI